MLCLGGAQGETVGHGGKFVAAADAWLAKAGREDAADGGHEGASSCKEDTVNFAGMDTGSLQKAIDTTLDGTQVVLDPLLKIAAWDRDVQVQTTVAKVELRLGLSRQFELDLLDGLVQLIAEVLVDKCDEGFNLLGFQRADAGALQDFSNVIGAQEGEIVPALEVGINPCRNGGKQLV